MNTVTASFNTTVRKITEIFQWRNCFSEKRPKCLSENTPRTLVPYYSILNWGVLQTQPF